MTRWLGVALVFVCVSSATAGPIILGGDATLTYWTADQVTGGPFWANLSYDRNGRANVGYYLAGVAGSDVPGFWDNSPRTLMPFVGTGTTTFVWDFGDAPPVIERLQGVTGWPQDELRFVPWGPYWELRFVTPAGTWSSLTLDGGRSHYALFRGTGAWYLGLEDATWTTARTADWDYNDLMIRIPDAPVPDAGPTLLLLAAGLLGLAIWVRRC